MLRYIDLIIVKWKLIIEKLNIIMRIFKRLIEKNGNVEWAECYKEILTFIQAEFYEKYNYTIKLN